MSTQQFPDDGILWRGWTDETLRAIEEEDRPVLLFVADRDPIVWPFLREILKEMPANPRLRALLHGFVPALLMEVDTLPTLLKQLGAGTRYHLAVLSPSSLTPMVTVDPMRGKPADVVNEIVLILRTAARRLVLTSST